VQISLVPLVAGRFWIGVLDYIFGIDTPFSSKDGFCGTTPEHCGKGCQANCDYKLGCDANNPCEKGCW
jgi:hypothetical protein